MSECNKSPEPVSLAWLDDGGGDSATPPETKLLTIANVAEMFGVSRLLLRFYEFRGLIGRNSRIDGQRVYSWAVCERLALIIKCRKVGLRLSDIVAVIEATDEDASIEAAKAGQEKSMALVEQLEHRRRAIEEGLRELSLLYALLNEKVLNESSRRQD